jgi:hypothetical protein
MQSFTFCIDDDRYDLPVRLAVTLPNGVAVRKHAQSVLEQNPHHREIEVFVAATSLFKVGGPAVEQPDSRGSPIR